MAKKEKQTSNIWGGGINEEGGKTGRGIYEDGEYADDLTRGKGVWKREMAAQREIDSKAKTGKMNFGRLDKQITVYSIRNKSCFDNLLLFRYTLTLIGYRYRIC